MLKNTLLIIFTMIFLIGCAGVPVKKLNNLEPGISKDEFVKEWGEPLITNYIDGHRVLEYLVNMGNGGAYYYWFVFNKENKLIGWNEKPRDSKSISGFIINLPIPQR